jgi:peroxiredoxin/Leucine-rich repeat (LRR) protein
MLHAKLKAAAIILLTIGALATVGAGVLADGQRPTTQPASPVAGRNEDIGRTIHFPDDRAVGIIYLLDTELQDLSAIKDYDRWKRIGEARGVVRLPTRGLVRLDLSRSAVADLSPLQQLDPHAIQVLRLRNLGARDDALRHVSQFKGLLRLDLKGNFFTGRALAHIAMLHDLLSLDLGDTTIGDDGIRQIAGLKSLREIDLGRTRITDRSLELLGSMSQLETLDLYQTTITDRGIAHLVGLENLRYLRISHTNTTNVALEHVAKLKNLEHFEFDDTRATDSGLAFLTGLKKLKSIRAFGNPFSDAGLAHFARLAALEELSAGNGTSFTDRGLAHLGQCGSLRILRLGGADHFTDEGLFHLAKLSHLEDLRISGRASRELRSAPAITDRGMASLRRNKTLKRLFLSDCRIGGEGLVSLSHLPALEALELAKTSLTFDDLRELDGFHNLKDFRLFTVANDSGRPTLRAFRSLESLEWLRLPDKGDARGAGIALDFEPAEFAHLSGLTKLKTLEYSGRLTDAGLRQLAPLKAMINLDVRNADVTDDGLQHLAGMKDLDELTIGGRITDEGLRHLANLQSLRVLQLNTRTVSLEGVKWLWERLPSLQMVPGFDDLHPLIVGERISYTKVGENARDFSVTMRDGKPFRLADHRGKVVLVHFWGPKCAPCIRTIPRLRELYQELSPRADRFIMISFTAGMEKRDWQAFLDDHSMDWPQALLSGDDLKVWSDFQVRGIPDYGVIGPDGKIVADGESTGREIAKLRAAIIEAMGH